MTDHLIIYPNFGQRISTWAIDSGCGKYEIPLMDTTDSDSVMLYLIGEEGNMKDIEYEYKHSKELFSIGMKVAISDEVNKYGRHVTGYISKINQDSVDIVADIDGKDRTYRINDYKIISAYGKSNQPDNLTVNIKSEDRGKLKLSYLFGNISWNAHYKIVIDEDSIKICTLSATIIDQNSENLSGDITLVAGSISRPSYSQPRSLMLNSAQNSSNVETTNNSLERFDEYYRYNIGYKELFDRNCIDLVTCTSTKSQKVYIHDVSSYDYVTYGYRFKAPTFFPVGKIYMYNMSNGDMIYSGTSQMEEYNEDDNVEIIIGNTNQVKIDTNIIKVVNQNDNKDNNSEGIDTIDIISDIINSKNYQVLVTLKYRIGTSKVLETSLPITRRNRGYLEWDMMANPGTGKVNINLTISK